MNSVIRPLVPFPSSGQGMDLCITATLLRQDTRLGLAYRMEGDLSSIIIPELAKRPRRLDNLWRETCLELYLAEPEEAPYWEFNLSPSGHWNVYRFSSYRDDRREEASIQEFQCSSSQSDRVLTFETEMDLGWIHLATRALTVGLSAVVRSVCGTNSYWALTHPGREPDFHRRDGFILRI